MEDHTFLDKIHRDHTKTNAQIENLNQQVQNLIKEKSTMKMDNQILEKNVIGITQQIVNLEKENVDLNEQIKQYKDKILKLNAQLKTKNVVKVIKGGRIKHNNPNESKIDDTLSNNKEVQLDFNNKTMLGYGRSSLNNFIC